MGHWHLKHWRLGKASTASSTYFQIAEAVQTVIRALGLADMPSESVLIVKLSLKRRIEDDAALSYPGVLITTGRDAIPAGQGSNLQDDYIYNITVTLLDSDNQERTLQVNHDKYLLWRQQVEKAFNQKPLSGVSSVYNCQVQPGDAVLPAGWAKNVYAAALLLKFTSRETRP